MEDSKTSFQTVVSEAFRNQIPPKLRSESPLTPVPKLHKLVSILSIIQDFAVYMYIVRHKDAGQRDAGCKHVQRCIDFFADAQAFAKCVSFA